MEMYYDLTFVVDAITDELVDHMYDQGDFDFNISGCDGLTLLSTTIHADDPVHGALQFAATLQDHDVNVQRLDHGLANQTVIAKLCGVTRQAVSLWVNNTDSDDPFPAPYTLVTDPLWAWGDVNEWLKRTGKSCAEDACYLTPFQIDQFNTQWAKIDFSLLRLQADQTPDQLEVQALKIAA